MVKKYLNLWPKRSRLVQAWLCLFCLITITPGTPGTPEHLFAQSSDPGIALPQSSTALPTRLPTRLPTDLSQNSIVARVYFRDQHNLNQLAARYDVWQVTHNPNVESRYFVALLATADMALLREQGYRVEVDEERTAQLDWPSIVTSAQPAVIPGFACYRTVEETYSSLAALATTHPQLATWTDIGDSWEKVTTADAAGYDIYVLKLTNQAIAGPKPVLVLMAAIHAREYATAELATRFAEELVAGYMVDPDVTWLLDYVEIHIIAQANPDGRKKAESGQLWRKNINNINGCPVPSLWGIDLNRNSSFMWNTGGSSSDTCALIYHGASAASEPETQTIESYTRSVFRDQRGPNESDAAPANTEGVFISLHSYSELVLFPWGYTTAPSPNLDALQTLGRKFGYHNGYQVCNGPACLYGTSGTTDDFTYGEFGVASYTYELGQNFFESCPFFEADIIPKNMPALYYAAKSARRPYQTPAGPDVINATATLTTTSAGPMFIIQAQADDTRYDSNGWGIEPSQPISAARLTINAPSWITTTQIYTMSAGDGQFDTAIEPITATLDASGWMPEIGKQLIMIEAQDSAGNWGAPTAIFVKLYLRYFPMMVQ